MSKEEPDEFRNQDYGQANGNLICDVFTKKMLEVQFWTNGITYFLIGSNYLLRTFCIMLVSWVGYSTETIKLERSTTATFIAQFFNTAFLLLMVNVNWSE